MYRFAFHPKLPKSRAKKQDIESYPELRKINHQEVVFNSREEKGKKPVPIGATWFASEGKKVEQAVILVPGRGHHRYSVPGFRKVIETLVSEGVGVLVLDPRTMGRSGGKRSALGLEEKGDVLGAFDYLTKEKGIQQISGLGMSQGAHALLLAAAEADVDFKKIWLDSPHQNLYELLSRDAHGWLGLPNRLSFVIKPFIPTVLALARIRGMDFRKGDMAHAMEQVAKKKNAPDLRLTTREEDHRISSENTRRLGNIYIENRSRGLTPEAVKQKIGEITKIKPGRGHTNFLESEYQKNPDQAEIIVKDFFLGDRGSRESKVPER